MRRRRWRQTDYAAIRVNVLVIKNNSSNNNDSNEIQSLRTGFPREPLPCAVSASASLLITTAANIFLVELRRYAPQKNELAGGRGLY